MKTFIYRIFSDKDVPTTLSMEQCLNIFGKEGFELVSFSQFDEFGQRQQIAVFKKEIQNNVRLSNRGRSDKNRKSKSKTVKANKDHKI